MHIDHTYSPYTKALHVTHLDKTDHIINTTYDTYKYIQGTIEDLQSNFSLQSVTHSLVT
jgi:hypothetical protein